MATSKVLDFSQVKDQSGFNPKHKPAGEYLATIISFDDTKSKSGNEMWVFGVALKKDRKAIYAQYCLLGAEHLWKLRNLMMAAGIAVPKKKLKVDGNRLVGKDIGICLEDDEYEGKMKSTITSMFPASEFEGVPGDEDDEDESDEDVEEEEYEDEEPEDDSDEDDSDDEDEDEEPEPPAKPAKKAAPVRTSKAPARAKPKAKPAPVEEDEDELDVDDLDED